MTVRKTDRLSVNDGSKWMFRRLSLNTFHTFKFLAGVDGTFSSQKKPFILPLPVTVVWSLWEWLWWEWRFTTLCLFNSVGNFECEPNVIEHLRDGWCNYRNTPPSRVVENRSTTAVHDTSDLNSDGVTVDNEMGLIPKTLGWNFRLSQRQWELSRRRMEKMF